MDALSAGSNELEKIEESGYSTEELQKVELVKKEVSLDDTNTILQFGVSAQKQIASFSDSLLKEIKSKDAGESGELLRDLLFQIKDMDVDNLSEGSFLSKIPILGNLVNSTKKFIAKYESVGKHIDSIMDQLHSTRTRLMKDVSLMDVMYQKNLDYYNNLRIYIKAGEELLQEMQEVRLPEMKAKAEASNDSMEIQKYNDSVQQVGRFEKKIHDLKTTKLISIQTAPQIRLIQNQNQVLIERIQSSILNAIPLWKNQLVIAVTVLRQKKAVQLQKEVTNTTNDLLTKNSEMLKQSSLEVARESERGIVEIETLRKVNKDLILTIDETLKIQSEGFKKRQQAEVEIKKLEDELKMKLLNMGSRA